MYLDHGNAMYGLFVCQECVFRSRLLSILCFRDLVNGSPSLGVALTILVACPVECCLFLLSVSGVQMGPVYLGRIRRH